MMTLYHATSTYKYTDDEVVIASGPTTYYPNAVAALELTKPIEHPSRSICLFATEDPELAVGYLAGQRVEQADMRLYEVSMDDYHRAPFALIHRISKRLDGHLLVTPLLNEYWKPLMKWNFYEVFSHQMKVVREVAIPQNNQVVFKIKYQADFDQANNM